MGCVAVTVTSTAFGRETVIVTDLMALTLMIGMLMVILRALVALFLMNSLLFVCVSLSFLCIF